MKSLAFAGILFAAVASSCTAAQAQQAPAGTDETSDWEARKNANEGVIRIISGRLQSTAFRVTNELASAMSDVKGLRLLTMVGKGSVQNVSDVLYLKGVDLAIIQEDALDQMRDQKVHSGLERRINYIAKLYNEEVHVLAGRDISRLDQLAGKKVAFGPATDGSAVTAQIMFKRFKIKVEPMYLEHDVALELLRSGEIAAMVFVEGKPVDLFRGIAKEEGLAFVAVPFDDSLGETSYLPSKLTARDYPELVASNADVPTIAVGSLLVSFNWKPDTSRYKAIERFAGALFEKLPALQKAPFHPKWADVNLAAQVSGWTRLPAVDELLAGGAMASAQTCSEPVLRMAMQKFLSEVSVVPTAGRLSPAQTEKLVQDFKKWLENQPR